MGSSPEPIPPPEVDVPPPTVEEVIRQRIDRERRRRGRESLIIDPSLKSQFPIPGETTTGLNAPT